MLVLVGVGAVEFVVRRHDALGFAFFNGNFKTCEINLTEGSLIDDGVGGHPLDFLVVGGEVLWTCADAVFLNAGDVVGGHLASEIWVLCEVFEVTSAKRVSLHIESRSEKNADIVCGSFFANGLAH